MLTTAIIFVAGCLIAWQSRRHLRFGVIGLQLFLLVVVCVGAFQLESRQDDLSAAQDDITQTQDQLKRERLVRSRVQGEINRYVCNENNKQDRLLAGLIEVSIGGQSSFGAGIDSSSLSPFDLEVIRSIGKVQRLSETNPNQLKSAFQRALRQLQAETPCGAVVTAFLAASTTDDLKAIRTILQESSDDSLRSPKSPGSGKGQP